MEKLETAQKIWEKTTEYFEKIDDKEKKEWFKTLIEDLEKDSSINRLKDKWNSMTESQKLKLYKRHAITIGEALKNNAIYKYYSTIINGAINTAQNWWKNAVKFAFLEQIPCRFFVELGILDKPEWLTNEKLIDDVKKDAKNFNLYLWLCETICACIPDAQVAVPFIWIARHYTKWYKNHWTEVIISRLNQKKESAIKEQTSQALAEAMQDTRKSIKDAA